MSLLMAHRCTYQGLEFASGRGATADARGPAASVGNGAFDAEPTSAALNNGLPCSLEHVSTYSAVTGMALLGRNLYISRLLRRPTNLYISRLLRRPTWRTRRDGHESVAQACSHPGRGYRRL